MAKPFSMLKDKMSPEARDRADGLARTMLQEMALAELRKAKSLSQKQLAEELDVKQAAVSKMEHRTDMYISTLRHYIKALGGELEIKVHFPDESVTINQFKDIDSNEPDEQKNAG